MITTTAALLVVVALVAVIATHAPVRSGTADLGRRIREHLYGPEPSDPSDQPQAQNEDPTKAPVEDVDTFDYSIYVTDE